MNHFGKHVWIVLNATSIADFFHPFGWDWNYNVLTIIQYWEQFYIDWIRNGKSVFVTYPDNFNDRFIEDALKNLTNFMNFEWNAQRFNCVLECDKEEDYRKKASLVKSHLDIKSNTFFASKINSCAPNETYTWNIYSKTHITWINSAIRNVKHELQKRGLDSSNISGFEHKHWRIYVCPKN